MWYADGEGEVSAMWGGGGGGESSSGGGGEVSEGFGEAVCGVGGLMVF